MKQKDFIRKILILSCFICVLIIFLFLLKEHVVLAAGYTYIPMEKIPGFESADTDFPSYLLSITKFAIWTVGIAALLMIIIGGFMYITSAGNTSRTETAKTVIFDALYGLLVALAAWLLLYVINPDLVRVNISLKPAPTPAISPTPSRAPGTYSPAACQSVHSGACSVENMEKTCFLKVAEQASAICWGESGGRETIGSSTDKCQPGGEIVSWGLFQINLSVNKVAGLNCPSAFSQPYTSKNHNCTIKDKDLYDKCVAAAKKVDNNIQAACSIYQSGGWKMWGFNKNCNF